MSVGPRASTAACVLWLFSAIVPVVTAQVTPLTSRVTGLEGKWVRDVARTMPDACGGFVGPPAGEARTISFRTGTVRIDTDAYGGEFPLDGATGRGFDGRPGSISLDAGWMAVTMIRPRSDGGTHALREVYIVRDDVLTVWRTLTVNLPDGTHGGIGCGNHAAIVYRRAAP